MATDVDFRKAQEVTWTEDGHCPACDCCDQALCVAAWQETNTTCAAYVVDGHAGHLAEARYGPRCPCTVPFGATGRF